MGPKLLIPNRIRRCSAQAVLGIARMGGKVHKSNCCMSFPKSLSVLGVSRAIRPSERPPSLGEPHQYRDLCCQRMLALLSSSFPEFIFFPQMLFFGAWCVQAFCFPQHFCKALSAGALMCHHWCFSCSFPDVDTCSY